jgi:hypothetical protein
MKNKIPTARVSRRAAKKQLAKDPATEKHLAGKVRVDHATERAADAIRDRRQLRKDRAALADLEKAAARHPDSAKAAAAVRTFKKSHGL